MQCVVVQGFILHRAVALPTGCLFEALSKPPNSDQGFEVTREISNCVTGLVLRQESARGSECYHHRWCDEIFLGNIPKMQNLKQLRIVLGKGYLMERLNASSELRLNFDQLPCLAVLELDVEGHLAVYIHPGNNLDVLVVIASGALHVSDSWLAPHLDHRYGLSSCCSNELCQLPIATSKQMYLQLGMAYAHNKKAALADAEHSMARLRLLEYVVEGSCGWTARMPADFQPSSLQECSCGACLECLARAGVPILCDQAWTGDSFDKHLRPHCSGAS